MQSLPLHFPALGAVQAAIAADLLAKSGSVTNIRQHAVGSNTRHKYNEINALHPPTDDDRARGKTGPSMAFPCQGLIWQDEMPASIPSDRHGIAVHYTSWRSVDSPIHHHSLERLLILCLCLSSASLNSSETRNALFQVETNSRPSATV